MVSPAAKLLRLKNEFLGDHGDHSTILIDSGAVVSLWPHKSTQPSSFSGLRGVNGSVVNAWGIAEKEFQFGNERFVWPFRLADVPYALLGADFLYDQGLLPDLPGKRLIRIADMKVVGSSDEILQICPSVSRISTTYWSSARMNRNTFITFSRYLTG